MRLLSCKRRWATGAILLLLLAVGIPVAMAATSTVTAKGVTGVKAVTSADLFTVARDFNTPPAWVDVPGAAVKITVPANTRGVLLARFSAEASTGGDGTSGSVRVLVNGAEAQPAAGMDAILTTVRQGTASGSLDRVAGPLPAGTYTVKVQAAVPQTQCLDTPTCGSLTLDDWTFTVERARA